MVAQPQPGGVEGARHRSRPINGRWLSGPCRDIAERFDGLDDLASLVDAAESLLASEDWVEALIAPLIAALANDPWFEPPFRASRDPVRTGAVLIDTPVISIAVTVTDAHALRGLPAPLTLVVPGRVTVTRYVRGGDALLRRWRTEPADAGFSAALAPPCTERSSLVVTDGVVLTQDGRLEGSLIVTAERDIVALTATIKRGAAPLLREYAIADGRFVQAASADDAASRMEMLLTFLRVSGRSDAIDAFDSASRHAAFHLRWAAMREWLMLDARSAHPRLRTIAEADPNHEVRHAARATLRLLDERLAACPA